MKRPYQKLIAWQRAHELCMWTYRITKKFPKEERYALTNQIRRAAYSVPMNLAEGNARRSNKEKARFFEIALSSLEEVHYQCLLSRELEYITADDFAFAERCIQKTGSLTSSLRKAFL